MVDKYKVDLKRPPEPIQLKDATGPHELSDERNYRYLDDLFKMTQLDPLADLDSDYVYQLMNKDARKTADYPKYLSGVEEYAEDYAKHGPRQFYEDPDKGPEREVRKGDVISVYDTQWNSPMGVGILLHEARHRGLDDDVSQKIISNSEIPEEVFVRAMDTKYADGETASQARDYIGVFLKKNGFKATDQAIDSIIKYSNGLEEQMIKQKLDAKED